MKSNDRNVLGGNLQPCCQNTMTGYYRNGYCSTGSEDMGSHVICAIVTEEFLQFTKERGNDLSTARPELGFPGLEPGDRWCLCAERWKEAMEENVAPPVVLGATHESALQYVPLGELQGHAAS